MNDTTGGNAMKVGRLITLEGIEFNLESSQLRELTDYLRRHEINDAIAAEAGAQAEVYVFVDPEEYERAVQAAYFVRQQKAFPAAT